MNCTRSAPGGPIRASLDQVHVDYYGSMVPISQVLAEKNVSLLDARISVQPWEKGMGQKIERPFARKRSGLESCRAGRPVARPDAAHDRRASQGS